MSKKISPQRREEREVRKGTMAGRRSAKVCVEMLIGAYQGTFVPDLLCTAFGRLRGPLRPLRLCGEQLSFSA
jgi:hypothetical protein